MSKKSKKKEELDPDMVLAVLELIAGGLVTLVKEEPKLKDAPPSKEDLHHYTRDIVPPYICWDDTQVSKRVFTSKGINLVDIVPHPLEEGVMVIKSDEIKGAIPVARPGVEYTFSPFGDGSATLSPLFVTTGTVIYFPGLMDWETPRVAFDTVGFWLVEHVKGDGTAYLRRCGKGGVGTPQKMTFQDPIDLQIVPALHTGHVLLGEIYPGVWEVPMQADGWMGFNIHASAPRMDGVNVGQIVYSQEHASKVEIEVDRLARVSLNGNKDGIVLCPKEQGVDSERAKFSLNGFIVGLRVENMTREPMNLAVHKIFGC
jgi:hypothetical protein